MDILVKKILVATDFSEASDAALTYGRALARCFDATLFVPHVADVVTTGIGAEGGRFVDAQRDAEEAARRRVDALLTKAPCPVLTVRQPEHESTEAAAVRNERGKNGELLEN